MRYTPAILLLFLLFLSLLSAYALAYPSCNGFEVNTTLQNSSWLTGECYWGGGYLNLTWGPGLNYGFLYNVSTYQNPNATFSQLGGGTFPSSGSCITTTPSQYYPKSNYLVKIRSYGPQGYNGCYGQAFVIIGVEQQATTSSTPTSYYTTTFGTTTPPTTTVATTTLNLTTAPPTPSLTLSSYKIYAGTSINATVRGISPTDAVEIIVNGTIVASGLGVASYNPVLTVGNHSFEGYDVNRHAYSQTLTVDVLIPTTISTSVATTGSTTQTVSTLTSTTTAAPQNSTNQTSAASARKSSAYELALGVIGVGIIIYALARYGKIKKGGLGHPISAPSNNPNHVDMPDAK